MTHLEQDRLSDIQRQVSASMNEIQRIESVPSHARRPEDALRLMDLNARVGMMQMLYGDRITPHPRSPGRSR